MENLFLGGEMTKFYFTFLLSPQMAEKQQTITLAYNMLSACVLISKKRFFDESTNILSFCY